MSSVPPEFLSGSMSRHWVRLDSPVLGHLSNQEVSSQERTLDPATVSESTHAGFDGDPSADEKRCSP
jgi:hypothetical protein